MLREIIIFLVSKTKVDPSFPSSQCAIESFSLLFPIDRNSPVGGIMLFFREEIPSKLLIQTNQTTQLKIYSQKYVYNYIHRIKFTIIFTEINLRSKKWLLSCSYDPNLTLLNNHIQNISRHLDFY